jgi:hypothetical protein
MRFFAWLGGIMKVFYPLYLFILVLIIVSVACQSVAAVPGTGESSATFTQVLETSPLPQISATPSSSPPSERLPTNTPTPKQAQPTSTRYPTATLDPTDTPFPERDLHTVTDESNAIAAVIPVAWGETRSIPWTDAQDNIIGVTFMASSDVDRFLNWEAEGVVISVSSRLGKGYIQLLDEEYAAYLNHCNDTFHKYWDFDNTIYRGKYAVLNNCEQIDNSWLRVLSVVSLEDPGSYVARILAYDLPPIFGSEFADILMQFQVFPDNLP